MPDSFIGALESFAFKSKNRLVNLFDPPVLVLLYHRVTSLSTDPQLLAVSPDNFRAQLQFLKNNFPLVRFEDDWSKVKKPAVVITFDDGYADNVREALPIIEEIGVPATFFVSTSTIGSQEEFWWDELEHIILGDGDFPASFELIDSPFGKIWSTSTPAERQVLFAEIQPGMRRADAACRREALRQLRQWAKAKEVAAEAYRAMTVEELQRLARSGGVTIGAHTVTHVALSFLSVAEQREEIIASKRQLETWLQQEVEVFSYPYGSRSDYSSETVQLCKEAGFVKAAANFPAQAHRWTDPYQIPRYVIRNWPVEVFAEKLKGFWFS